MWSHFSATNLLFRRKEAMCTAIYRPRELKGYLKAIQIEARKIKALRDQLEAQFAHVAKLASQHQLHLRVYILYAIFYHKLALFAKLIDIL